MSRATIRGVVLTAILFAGGAFCRADITDVHTKGEIQADAQVANATNPADPNPARDDDRPPDELDITTYNRTAMASAAKEGRQADGKAQQQTQVTIQAKSISVTSTSSTEANRRSGKRSFHGCRRFHRIFGKLCRHPSFSFFA